MGDLAIAVVTLAVLAIGLVMGLIAMVIAANSSLDRTVAFGWGAVLGPIGVIVVLVLVNRSHRVHPTADPSTW